MTEKQSNIANKPVKAILQSLQPEWNRFSGSQGNCSALKLHRAMLPGCDIVALAVPTPARSPLESLLVSREFIALMVSEGEVVLLPGERRRPRLRAIRNLPEQLI
jgi:hypothetical protein